MRETTSRERVVAGASKTSLDLSPILWCWIGGLALMLAIAVLIKTSPDQYPAQDNPAISIPP
jgi:hypothetical protein